MDAARGKGLQIDGTFARRNGTIFMDMTFSNKAMTVLNDFAIQVSQISHITFQLFLFQFNNNSFGLIPADKLAITSINPNQSVEVALPCQTSGPVAKMDPLTNLQVSTIYLRVKIILLTENI